MNPEIASLVKSGRNYSLDDQRYVIARERELLSQVLPAHADAAKRGSVEISTSPFYHPILPLVCDTNVGGDLRQACPCRKIVFSIQKTPMSNCFVGSTCTNKCLG